MRFDQYLATLPMLHSWDGGATWNTGGFQAHHLERLHAFLTEHLPEHPVILETGAGNSTISLLFLAPSRLVSIAPEEQLFARIRTYCTQNGIADAALESIVDCSEWVLPRIASESRDSAKGEFDFVLIDGCHNWPMVFVDFFYANFLLKAGGYLMIDDLQLHSVKELARLLSEHPDFKIVLDLGKSLVFQRTSADRTLAEWNYLNYIIRKTEEYAKTENPFKL